MSASPSENPQTHPTGSLPNVARAGGIMVFSLFLSRVLGLVRDMVITGTFGSTELTDAYILAFSVPDLLFFLIAGGALSSAFIPIFSEYLHTEREREAWHIFSVVTTVMSVVVVAFIVGAWIFAEPLVRLVAPGAEMTELIAYMSRIVLPAQYAFFIGGLFIGTLYARQVFAVPGLGPNIYNLGIIFGALVISNFVVPGVVGMTWGALVGAVVGNLLIPGYVMWRMGARFTPSFDVSHPGVKKVFKLMLPVVLGLSLPGVYALIMRFYGTFFGESVVSWLHFANQLMQAPLGIFGQSLAIAVFPALTQFFAQQRMDLVRKQLSTTIRTVIYLTVPISAFMAVAATQIVAALYQHGKFEFTDTIPVANCLRWFSIGIAAWCLHPVLMRGFFAIQNTLTPIVLGSLTTLVFVGISSGLAFYSPMRFYALPLASSISAILLVIAMMLAIRKQTDGLDFAGIFQTLGKSALAAGAFALVTWLVLQSPLGSIGTHNKLVSVLLVMALGIPGAGVYFWVTKRLGMPETAYLDRMVARLSRKAPPPTKPEPEA